MLGHQTQPPFARGLWLDRGGALARTQGDHRRVRRADARAPRSPRWPSGGNQQKLIVGREMTAGTARCSSPRTRPAASTSARKPTSGTYLREASCRRAGRPLVSADLEELIGLSDTLLVFLRGRVVAHARPGDGHPGRARLVHDGRAGRAGRGMKHKLVYALAAPVLAVVVAVVVSSIALLAIGESPVTAFRAMCHLDRLGRRGREHPQPRRPVLRDGPGGRARLQDGPVQHRRGRAVPHRGAARGRRRRRGHPAGAAARAVHRPRRHGRRGRLRRDRRRAEGDPGRERGRLDHHAQLHRHRHHRLPAVGLPAQQEGQPPVGDEAHPPVGVAPVAQPGPELDRLPPHARHDPRRASSSSPSSPGSSSTSSSTAPASASTCGPRAPTRGPPWPAA